MSNLTPDHKSKVPSPRIAVDLPNGRREFFMSYGLLDQFASLVGGVEAVPNLFFDRPTSDAALTLLLARRDKRGAILEPGVDDPPTVPLDLDPLTGEQLLHWVAEHVMDFFVRRFAMSSKLCAEKADQLAAVGSSLTSSST